MKHTILALVVTALFAACTSVPPAPATPPSYSSGITPKGEVQPICKDQPWIAGCYGQKGG